MLEEDIQEILFSHQEIAARVRALAGELTRDYRGKNLVVVGTLRGAFIFMADLVRAMDLPLVLDFMSVSSYGGNTESSGQVNIRLDLSEDIAGRDVLIVEDIIDSGNTLSKLREELRKRNPASVKICALLDKPSRRTRPLRADYVGFTVPDAFVVGYGLDYDQRYRQLPYIGVLKPRVYEAKKGGTSH